MAKSALSETRKHKSRRTHDKNKSEIAIQKTFGESFWRRDKCHFRRSDYQFTQLDRQKVCVLSDLFHAYQALLVGRRTSN